MICASQGVIRLDSGEVEFLAKEGVLIGVPDAQKREHYSQVVPFILIYHVKEAQQFVLGGQLAIGDDGEDKLFGLLRHAFHQRHQKRLFGLEVVIKRAPGNLKTLQEVLGRHLLVAFGRDVALGDIQNGVALLGVFLRVDSARHLAPLFLDRQTVYL